MFFEYPKLLWLLVVPALLVLHYIYLELAQRHPHLRVSTSIPWLVENHFGKFHQTYPVRAQDFGSVSDCRGDCPPEVFGGD
jgi:hypothetical protein